MNEWQLVDYTSRLNANELTIFVTGLSMNTTLYDFKLMVTGGSNAGESNIVSQWRTYP